MKNIGLILEGGGMRGVFTAGVLETFLEKQVGVSDIYALSAGATAAVTYLSGQVGRNKRVFIDYVRDPRYKSFLSWLLTGSYFNQKFIFDTVPHALDPFDYQAFFNNDSQLHIAVTRMADTHVKWLSDFKTQEALLKALLATTSLPILSRPVEMDGDLYVDGGVACPMILDKALEAGHDHLVAILTQPRGFRKVTSQKQKWYPLFLKKHPQLIEALATRAQRYNAKLAELEALEDAGKIFVIRPDPLTLVTRMEKDPQKMQACYKDGLQKGLEAISTLPFLG